MQIEKKTWNFDIIYNCNHTITCIKVERSDFTHNGEMESEDGGTW